MIYKESNKFKTLVFLIAISIFIFFILLPIFLGLKGIPEEDAAILYSYSNNLAKTGVISYFPGGERAEGATDFGWMVSIALGQLIGLKNHLSAGLLSSLSISLLGLRQYSIAQQIGLKDPLIKSLAFTCLFCSICFGGGAFLSGLGGFSTIASGCLLCVLFLSLLFYKLDILFIGSSIYYILLRPDHIYLYVSLLIVFLLTFLIFPYPMNRQNFLQSFSLKKFKIPSFQYLKNTKLFQEIAILALPIFVFISYWFLRASYFDDFFPLPYYVKSSNTISSPLLHLFKDVVTNNYSLKTYFILLLLALLVNKIDVIADGASKQRKVNNIFQSFQSFFLKEKVLDNASNINYAPERILNLSILACLLFSLFQNIYLSRFLLSQNVYDRFHSPALALAACLFSTSILFFPPNIASFFNDINNIIHSYPYSMNSLTKRKIYILSIMVSLLFLSLTSLNHFSKVVWRYSVMPFRVNIVSLAKDFRRINQSTTISKMIVTDAGRLNYYSGLPTIDAYGLNTSEYARIPLIDVNKVLKEDPCIIHAGFRKDKDYIFQPNQKKEYRTSRDYYVPLMKSALYEAAKIKNHQMYVVPYFTDYKPYSQNSGRVDLFTVNPQCPAYDQIRISLMAHGAIQIPQENMFNKTLP